MSLKNIIFKGRTHIIKQKEVFIKHNLRHYYLEKEYQYQILTYNNYNIIMLFVLGHKKTPEEMQHSDNAFKV